MIIRHGGAKGAGTARSAATSRATSTTTGGHSWASALAAAARNASIPMLYFVRMAREAQLQLLSRYENIELAEEVLAELCRNASVDDETVYWIGMALREALANAIKHGNKLNPEKRVHVRIEVRSGAQLRLIVEDEGEGFDPEQLVNPTDPQNLLRSSGRGVFYMRNFMDTVSFYPGDQGGTRIELTKNLDTRREA